MIIRCNIAHLFLNFMLMKRTLGQFTDEAKRHVIERVYEGAPLECAAWTVAIIHGKFCIWENHNRLNIEL